MRPAIALLPGLLCDDALWQPVIPLISDLAEAHVADLTRHESVSELAKSVLAELPERFVLCGLSMGGYVALEIMRIAPERITALILSDTTARPDSPEAKQKRQALLALSASGKFKGVTPRLLPQLVAPDHVDDPAIGGVVLAMAERVGSAAFRRQQTAIMNRIDSRPHLPAIRVPTLLIYGADDALTPPEHGHEMAGLIPGAKLEIIPQCGHLPPLEAPQVMADRLRSFLADVIC